MTCKKLDIYMDLPFRPLQEELTPCYTKMSGATVYHLTECVPQADFELAF